MPSSSPYIFARIPKLPPKYGLLVMPLLMSGCMSCLVSLTATLRSVGWSSQLFSAWMGNWLMGWLVAFPVLFVVMPLAKKITTKLVRSA